MTQKPSEPRRVYGDNRQTFNPFPFLDRDPEAIGDQIAREMSRDEASVAIQRAETWLRYVREWEAARRYRKEQKHE